jgi:GT2 family glycosyltransferase
MSGQPGRVARLMRAAVLTGSATAAAATAHTAYNLTRLRVPARGQHVAERVSVLLPVRDEAATVAACMAALLAQDGVPDLEILVLDDGSTDGTADVAGAVAAGDERVRVLDGTSAAIPAGWTGKAWACHRLAVAASGEVLVFVDADVVLAPDAVAAAVALLRGSGLDLVSPYPRQVAETLGERLVQPLLQWSWLTTLPLALAERPGRPSLAAANGQFLAVDTAAYRRAGGHARTPGAVLDDVELLRAVKRSGGCGTVVDGTAIATCRMYAGWAELEAGYGKSLWSAFRSGPRAAALMGGLSVAYVLPVLAALRGSRVGWAGYLAGVSGRAMVARRVGGRVWPDSLAHPASVTALAYLTARSFAGRRAGSLTWKGRPLP